MSLNDVLTSVYPNPEPWKNFSVNDFKVAGNLTVSGSTTQSGNIAVVNANPSIEIRNTTTNVNRATLQLQGASNVAPAKLQQGGDGSVFLQTFEPNKGIIFFPNGTGSVGIIGPNYPAGPYLLGLDAGNNIVPDPLFSTIVNFTPVMEFGNTPISVGDYLSRAGRFIKVGNVVFFYIELIFKRTLAVTGNALISGLPANVIPILDNVCSINLSALKLTTALPMYGFLNAGQAIMSLKSTIGNTSVDDTNFFSTADGTFNQIGINGFYFSS